MLSFITLRSKRKKKATQKQAASTANAVFQPLNQQTPPSPQRYNSLPDVISIGESPSYVRSTIPTDVQTVTTMTTTTTAVTGASRSNDTSPAIQIEFNTEPLLFDDFLKRRGSNDLLGEAKVLSTKTSSTRSLKTDARNKLEEAQRQKGSLPVTPVSSSTTEFPSIPSPTRQSNGAIMISAPPPPSSFHSRIVRTTSVSSQQDSTISGLTTLLEPFSTGFNSPVSTERRSGVSHSGPGLTRGDSMTLPKDTFRKSKDSEMWTPRNSRSSRNNNTNYAVPPLPSPANIRADFPSDFDQFDGKAGGSGPRFDVKIPLPPTPVTQKFDEEPKVAHRVSRISEKSSPAASYRSFKRGKGGKVPPRTTSLTVANAGDDASITTPSSSVFDISVSMSRSDEPNAGQYAHSQKFLSYPPAPITASSNSSEYNLLSSSPISWRSTTSRGRESSDPRKRRSRSRSSRKSISLKGKQVPLKVLNVKDNRSSIYSKSSAASAAVLLPIGGDRRNSVQSSISSGVSSNQGRDSRRLSTTPKRISKQADEMNPVQVTVSPPVDESRNSSPDLLEQFMSESPSGRLVSGNCFRSGAPPPIRVLRQERPHGSDSNEQEDDGYLTVADVDQTLPETPDLFSPLPSAENEQSGGPIINATRESPSSPRSLEANDNSSGSSITPRKHENFAKEIDTMKIESPISPAFSQLAPPLKPPLTPPSTDTSPSLASVSFLPSTPPHSRTSHFRESISLHPSESTSSLKSSKSRPRPPVPLGPRRPSRGSLRIHNSPSSHRLRSGSTASTVQATDDYKGRLSMSTLHTPDFTSLPVQWKGITVDEARWTWSDSYLQNSISQAVRESSQASKLRLLRTEVLENELPAESARLTAVLNELKTDHRVQLRRRQQLLAALELPEEGPFDPNVLSRVAGDLIEVTSICDQICEKIYRARDQLAQLENLQEMHYFSALSMALHKLNSSFVRQVRELAECKQELSLVHSEKEEILKHAEVIAKDYDELNESVQNCEYQSTDDKGAGSRRSSYASRSGRRLSQASVRLSRVSSRHNIRYSINSPRLSISATRSRFPGSVPPVPPVPLLTVSPDRASSASPMDAGSETGTWDREQRELLEQLGINPRDLSGTLSRPQSAIIPGMLRPESPIVSDFQSNSNSRSTSHARTNSLPEDLKHPKDGPIKHNPEAVLAILL